MRTIVAFYISFIVGGVGLAPESSKDTSALALLRGVEQARNKYENLRVELTLEYADRTTSCTIPCLVEQTGHRRRFEQFAGGCLQEGIVIFVNDRELWGYRRGRHQDLDIYDMDRSSGVRGDIAFDPRNIGLDEIDTSADTTLRALLGFETSDQLELMGREELKGVRVWRLQARQDDVITDFWIEEPSFRVHKVVCRDGNIQDGNINIEINSEYDQKDTAFPFPKRVEIIRQEGKKWRRLEITVKSFEVDKPIPAERFTMNSIGMPVNTMINDYRLNRIIGYWDGQGISKDPVYPGQKTTRRPQALPKRPHRLLFIGLNVAVIIAMVTILIWRWRRRVAAAK